MKKEEIVKEKNHLEYILKILKKCIIKNKSSIEKISLEILDMKKYCWKNKKEIDSPERLSFENQINVNANIGESTIMKNMLYQKMLDNTYFGRVDFDYNDQEKKDKIYIGITSLVDNDFEILVYDWRSPIASLFYDYEIGNAFYLVNQKKINGNIDLKRQYKIENGILRYAIDSSLNINDEILQETLNDNSTDKMKNIVSTIQKEQNQVIRDISNSCLVVEGVAGSGKTSVAMHRIAYLLYKFKDNLNSNETLIFSPNKIFSQYISDVLPELGENNVLYTSFSDYVNFYIDEYSKIENYMEFIERIYEIEENQNKEYIKFKMSGNFISLIENYIKRASSNMEFKTIKIGENFIITAAELKELYDNSYKKMPPFLRIQKIVDYIAMKYSHQSNEKFNRKILIEKINKKFEHLIDCKKIMIDMYNDEIFKNEIENINKSIDIENFCKTSIKNLKLKNLNYEDVSIFLYIKGKLKGFGSDNSIKQVVIDEAQDYSKLQYIIIKNIFRKAKFTILGDSNQVINPLFEYESLKEIEEIFKESNTKYIKLNTSYRNTYEITKYVNKILDLENINLIARHGEEPKFEMIENLEKTDDKILKIIKENSNKKIGIITRTIEDVKKISKYLEKNKIEHTLYNKEKWSNLVILPIYYAKGLEFDSVIVYDSMENPFVSDYPKMFYVACTRALHKLDIISENSIKIS